MVEVVGTRSVRRRTPADASTRYQDLLASLPLLGRELTVEGRLRQLVGIAPRLAAARFAALALLTPDGSVERFLTSSRAARELRALAGYLREHHLEGAPLLPQPINPPPAVDGDTGPVAPAAVLTAPLDTPLGRIGTLYVLGPIAGTAFSPLDQEVVGHFVRTAGVALENATHLEESRQRQHWLTASADVARQLLEVGDDELAVWRAIATNLRFLAGARTVTIVRPSDDDPEELRVHVASGIGAGELVGRSYGRAGTLAGWVISCGEARVAVSGEFRMTHGEVEPAIAVGQVLALPLKGRGEARGAILVSRQTDEPPFSPSDVRMAEDFATHATLALEVSEARFAQQVLEAQEDRERITETLQDQVLQRLFSIGLSLQANLRDDLPEAVRQRLALSIAEVDETIRQVRGAIDPVGRPATPRGIAQLRTALLDVLGAAEEQLGTRPAVTLRGPLDTVVDADRAAAIATLLRRALAGVARHAQAGRVEVEVVAEGDGLRVLVTDDGVDLGARGEGLVLLWRDAAAEGLAVSVEQPTGGGVRVCWTLPRR